MENFPNRSKVYNGIIPINARYRIRVEQSKNSSPLAQLVLVIYTEPMELRISKQRPSIGRHAQFFLHPYKRFSQYRCKHIFETFKKIIEVSQIWTKCSILEQVNRILHGIESFKINNLTVLTVTYLYPRILIDIHFLQIQLQRTSSSMSSTSMYVVQNR